MKGGNGNKDPYNYFKYLKFSKLMHHLKTFWIIFMRFFSVLMNFIYRGCVDDFQDNFVNFIQK